MRSSGELPWRTNFGAGLGLLRHQRNGAALKELARIYVRDAFKLWVPGAQLVSITVEQDGPRSRCAFASASASPRRRWACRSSGRHHYFIDES